MRVMVCYYFFERAIPLGSDLATGFEALGHSVFKFDSTISHRFGRFWKFAKSLAKLVGHKATVARRHEQLLLNALCDRFVKAADAFKPELIVVIQGERIDARVVQSVSLRHGAKSVLWWVKPPRWQDSIFEDQPYYDLVCSIDGSVNERGVAHLPSWGLNREIFKPGEFADKERELFFVGSWSQRRQDYLEVISDLPLKIIGSGWSQRLTLNHPLRTKLTHRWVGGPELADVYRKAWAVIDIPQFEQLEGQGVNMRFADVPACGTVLITPASLELAKWFREGAEVLSYTCPKELRSLCEGLLSDADLCKSLSESAALAAAKLPTFADRASALLS